MLHRMHIPLHVYRISHCRYIAPYVYYTVCISHRIYIALYVYRKYMAPRIPHCTNIAQNVYRTVCIQHRMHIAPYAYRTLRIARYVYWVLWTPHIAYVVSSLIWTISSHSARPITLRTLTYFFPQFQHAKALAERFPAH